MVWGSDSQGKLVVGHNMLLDVMHTIHQFYCPLPEVKSDPFSVPVVLYELFKRLTCSYYVSILFLRIFKTLKKLQCVFSQGNVSFRKTCISFLNYYVFARAG